MKYDIPGVGTIEINTIVLDLNGTLFVMGKIVDGVVDLFIDADALKATMRY